MALAHVEAHPAFDDPDFTVGNRIAKRRRDLGIDQETLAREVGVSRPLVSKWERDKSLPDVDQARKLAQTLQCSFGWLCGVDARSRCFAQLTLLDGGDEAVASMAGAVDRHPANGCTT